MTEVPWKACQRCDSTSVNWYRVDAITWVFKCDDCGQSWTLRFDRRGL